MAIRMWDAKLYTLVYGKWTNDYFDPGYCDEQFRRARNLLTWAIVRADGVVIAQSVGADVSALKAEAA